MPTMYFSSATSCRIVSKSCAIGILASGRPARLACTPKGPSGLANSKARTQSDSPTLMPWRSHDLQIQGTDCFPNRPTDQGSNARQNVQGPNCDEKWHGPLSIPRLLEVFLFLPILFPTTPAAR
jgi:hypothetical protein